MKKIFFVFALLSAVAFAGGVTNNNSSHSSNSQSSSDESSDGEEDHMDLDSEENEEEDDESPNIRVDSDEQDDYSDHVVERGHILELLRTLGSRSIVTGESVFGVRRSRSEESSEVEPQNKRQRTRNAPSSSIVTAQNDEIPPRLRTPPAEGGTLWQLLNWPTPVWHDPFLAELDPLDILCLYATCTTANERFGIGLELRLRTQADFFRMLELVPARSTVFLHLTRLQFDFTVEGEISDVILTFLEENIEVLANLQVLDISASDDPYWGQRLLRAALKNTRLAQFLVRTHCIMEIRVAEQNLWHFFGQMPRAVELGLHQLLIIRLQDDDGDLHRLFFENAPRHFNVFGLILEGATFSDHAMGLLAQRMRSGDFASLRVLRVIESGLDARGLDILGQLIASGALNSLERLQIDHTDVPHGIFREDALGLVLRFFEHPEMDLTALLPRLHHFEFGGDELGIIDPHSTAALITILERGAFPMLRELLLEFVFTQQDVDALIRILPHLRHLQRLVIGYNQNLPQSAIDRLRAALPDDCQFATSDYAPEDPNE